MSQSFSEYTRARIMLTPARALCLCHHSLSAAIFPVPNIVSIIRVILQQKNCLYKQVSPSRLDGRANTRPSPARTTLIICVKEPIISCSNNKFPRCVEPIGSSLCLDLQLELFERRCADECPLFALSWSLQRRSPRACSQVRFINSMVGTGYDSYD